ncbi:EF hand family protein [Cryptosporidium serpentis]
MYPIWTNSNFLDITIGTTWNISSDILDCDAGKWFNVCNSARFYVNILDHLMQNFNSIFSKYTPGYDIFCVNSIKECIGKVRNSISPISEESTWIRLKSLYERSIMRRSVDYEEFHHFVIDLITKVRNIESGSSIVFPGIISIDYSSKPIFVLYIISKLNSIQNNVYNGYIFSLVNVSGYGTEYHAFSNSLYSKNPTLLLRDSVMVISDIYPDRLLHSSFWICLYRLSIIPSTNNIHYLYTVLLPFLNSKQLLNNWIYSKEDGILEINDNLLPKEDTNKLFKGLEDSLKNDNTVKKLDLRFHLNNIWIPSPRRRYVGSSNKLLRSALQLLYQIYLVNEVSINMKFVSRQFQIYMDWILLKVVEDDLNRCILSKFNRTIFPTNIISTFISRFCRDISNYSLELSIYEDSIKNNVLMKNIGNIKNIPNLPFKEWFDYINNFKAFYEQNLSANLKGYGIGLCTLPKSLASSPLNILRINGAFNNWGSFRIDGPNVMLLAGEGNEPLVDIPVEIDSIHRNIEDIEDVVIVLEVCNNCCLLLANQSESIRNSYLLRFKLIQYIFHHLIPFPLPWGNPKKSKYCFWARKGTLKRSQQVYLLSLLCNIVRHFVTCSFSIYSLAEVPDANRIVTLGIISCIADNITRCFTVDYNSPLSIHLLGNHLGPKNWFYIDLMNFQEITDYALFPDPSIIIMRTMVLDYFYSIKEFPMKNNLDKKLFQIFCFEEKPGTLDDGTLQLLSEICTEYGFPIYEQSEDNRKGNTNNLRICLLPLYFTGENQNLMDIIPEFYSLRDIIFYMKLFISQASDATPNINRWNPGEAYLKWAYNSYKDIFTVKAFDKFLQCAYISKNYQGKSTKGLWSSFAGWFTNSDDKSNSRIFTKMTDPTTLILSIENMNNQSKTTTSTLSLSCQTSISNETDILYIRSLPHISDFLQPNEVECILQYLTTPYVRIPLLLQFFCDEGRINALSSTPVQHILWASLTEPWQWQSPKNDNKDPISFLIPSDDLSIISTPCGLLFNELINSSSILKYVEEMLLIALDKDTGSYCGNNSIIILFVLRLAIMITNYCKYIIVQHNYWVNIIENKQNSLISPLLQPKNDPDTYQKNYATDSMQKPRLAWSGSSWTCLCRGFENIINLPVEDNYPNNLDINFKTIKTGYRRIRYIIESMYVKVIKDWMKKALNDLKISELCVLYAHIAYIYGEVRNIDELDLKKTAALLSSLVFISTHFGCKLECRNLVANNCSSEKLSFQKSFETIGSTTYNLSSSSTSQGKFTSSNSSNTSLNLGIPWDFTVLFQLGVSEMELADIQTKARHWIIKWLEINPGEANLVLDTVVNAVTLKGIGIIEDYPKLEDSKDSKKQTIELKPCTREWIQLPSINGKGRFVPINEIPADLYEWIKCDNIRKLDLINNKLDTFQNSKSSYSSANWWKLKRLMKLKRIIGNSSTNENSLNERYDISQFEYYEWFKTILSINTETEINIQLSLFSLKNNNLKVLGSWINEFKDFMDVLRECEDESSNLDKNSANLTSNSQYQCAEIANNQNLYWCRLIGSRIDLYRWEPFQKTIQVTFCRKYCANNLPAGSEWITELFEPWRVIFLKGISTIYIEDPETEKDNQEAQSGYTKKPDLTKVVRLQFLYPLYNSGEGPSSPNTKTGSTKSNSESGNSSILEVEIVTHSLKEIVVYRFPPVVMVFDIVEHGRLYYKQLCHTSNISYSLGYCNEKFITPWLGITESIQDEDLDKSNASCYFTAGNSSKYTLGAGIPLQRGQKPRQSLVIMRDYYPDPVGTEMYIPSRFLFGLLPQALIETHEFWQSQITGNIRGYPRKNTRKNPKQIDSHNIDNGFKEKGSLIHQNDLYLIDIYVIPTSKTPDKFGFIGNAISLIERRYIYDSSIVHTLINIQSLYDSTGRMRQLFNTIQRLEDLSHILLWSINKQSTENSRANRDLSLEQTVDIIEFPRLHLIFNRKDREGLNTRLTALNSCTANPITGTVRYICEQHSGLYISWKNLFESPLACELLCGIPHSILLENDDGDLFILVPATTKPILIPPVYGEYLRNELETSSNSPTCSSGSSTILSRIPTVDLDTISSVISQTTSTANIISENFEAIMTSPGQYVASMASVASQRLYDVAVDAISKSTKNMIDNVVNSATDLAASTISINFVNSNSNMENLSTSLYEYDNRIDSLGSPTSSNKVASFLYRGSYILDRGDDVWLSRLGPTKHYLYPIHTSKSFVFINSVVSGLYLMLWRFLEQKFESVISILDTATCSDMENYSFVGENRNSEEDQLWQLFNSLNHFWDCHPDAHACRLKLWLHCIRNISSNNSRKSGRKVGKELEFKNKKCAANNLNNNSNMTSFLATNSSFICTWEITKDIEAYCYKYEHVSANCRLSIEEELEVLQAFPHFVKENQDLNNRLNLISAVLDKQKERLKQNCSLSEYIEVPFFNPPIPQIDDFDSWVDTTCLGVPEVKGSSTSVWNNLSNILGTISAPPSIRNKFTGKIVDGTNIASSSIVGLAATEFIMKFLNRGSIGKFISDAISSTAETLIPDIALSSTTTGNQSTSSLAIGTSLIYLSDWLFIYELLTGSFPIQIIPGESSYIWGILFTRSLPVWDWKSPNILVSILKLLILNPGISLSSKMPKYFEDKKSMKLPMGVVLKSQESFQKLIKEIIDTLKLEYKKGHLVIELTMRDSGSKVTKNKQNTSNIFKSVASDFGLLTKNLSGFCDKFFMVVPWNKYSRWHISLNRGDYNCQQRQLKPIIISSDSILSESNLKAFSTYPNSVFLNSSKFITPDPSSPEYTQNPIGAFWNLPDQLMEHPISSTTIGRTSLNRYRGDITEYQNKIKSKAEYSILGINKDKLYNSIMNSVNMKDSSCNKNSNKQDLSWDQIRQGIMDLRMSLLQLFYNDGKFVDSSMKKLDQISNYNQLSNTTGPDCYLFWSNCFGKIGGCEPVLRFDYLVSQLMNSNSFQDIKFLNPFISESEIDVIHSLTAAIMMTVNRRSQVSMALIQIRDILSYMAFTQNEVHSNLLTNSKYFLDEQSKSAINDETNKPNLDFLLKLLTCLEMKLKNLARVLTSQRYYISLKEVSGLDISKSDKQVVGHNDLSNKKSNSLIALYDPRFLVFEFAYNILLRKDQVELIHNLYNSALNGQSICHQMIMGAGKTTVISPLLALLLGSSTRLVIQIVPQALLEFTRNVLRSRFSCIIKKRILIFQFQRSSICTPELYKKLVHAKEQKAIVLCHPTAIKSLFLKAIYLFRLLRYWNVDNSNGILSSINSGLNIISSATNIKASLSLTSQSSFKQFFGWNKDSPYSKVNRRPGRNIASTELNSELEIANSEKREALYLQFKRELDLCLRILHIFKLESVVLIDEIDLILHPLRSELHWPIGTKYPIDLGIQLYEEVDGYLPSGTNETNTSIASINTSKSSQTLNSSRNQLSSNDSLSHSLFCGIRWLIPWYLIEALLTPALQIKKISHEQARNSGIIKNLLVEIQKVVQQGIEKRSFQNNPHLILLDTVYYSNFLKSLLTKWIIFFIRSSKFSGTSDIIAEIYIMNRGNINKKFQKEYLDKFKVNFSDIIRGIDGLDELNMKVLNLAMLWINDYLPHIFQMVHRVSYGLLDEQFCTRKDWLGIKELEQTFESLKSPRSRHLLAIPFIGKDTPSLASEFSHPDIVIGLTILSYRYQGLRRNDLYYTIKNLKENFEDGYGPYKERPAAIEFNKWIELAGGRVRGTKRGKLNIPDYFMEKKSNEIISNFQSISSVKVREDNIQDQMKLLWSLDVLNLNDEEQLNQLHGILAYQPYVIGAYLHRVIFPLLMEYSEHQLSASGQEIGGDMLFSVRIGFSGTPSDLLPIEIGKCRYERGSDGEMIHYLTSGAVISSVKILEIGWTVEGFLLNICRRREKEDLHVLIDTGAFITGYTNQEVAKFLLRNGLRGIEAVVFIDDKDKQMIMLRDGFRIIEISQCGISLDKRFTFYDHIHTTGQDIKHTPLAEAILTIGKDMIFRDFAQGAYRMRQLGQGQTINIVIQVQVADLIEKNSKICGILDRNQCLFKEVLSKKDVVNNGNIGCEKLRNNIPNKLDQIYHLKSNITLKDTPNELIDMTEHLSSEFIIPDLLTFLRCLCGWLIIQSIISESEQNQLLCSQSLSNIWRKLAFQKMVDTYVQWEDEKNCSDRLLEVFIEALSFKIPATIPLNTSLKEELIQKVTENTDILNMVNSSLSVDKFKNTINETLLQVDEMADYKKFETSFDREMEQELEMEIEQEQEQEQEQEKEQEREQEIEQDDSVAIQKWIRPEEKKVYWTLSILNKIASLSSSKDETYKYSLTPFASFSAMNNIDKQATLPSNSAFLPLSKYCIPYLKGYDREDNGSLSLSENLKFSVNLYNPLNITSSHSKNACQRLNNFTIILEWEPLELKSRSSEQEISTMPSNYLEQLKEAFAIFDGKATGKISISDLGDLLKTLNWVENTSSIERHIVRLLDKKYGRNSKENSTHTQSCKFNDQHTNTSVELQILTVNNLLNIPGKSTYGNNSNYPQEFKHDMSRDSLDFMYFLEYDHPWNNTQSSDNLNNCSNFTACNIDTISFNDLYDALNILLSCTSNCHFSAISLEEAQMIRWIIHQVKTKRLAEIQKVNLPNNLEAKFDLMYPDITCNIKLHNLHYNFSVIDELGNIQKQNKYKIEHEDSLNSTYLVNLYAQAIYRFINSESIFTDNEVGATVRILQNSSCKKREEYYLELRRCRRRKQNMDWKETNLAIILTTPNECAVLQCRGLASRLNTRLQSLNITLLDFFKSIDKDHTGQVSAAQLYASLDSLQIAPNPRDFGRIVRFVFRNSISQVDFIKAFTLDSIGEFNDIIHEVNDQLSSQISKNSSIPEVDEAKVRAAAIQLTADSSSLACLEFSNQFDLNFISKIKCRFVQHHSFLKVWEVPSILSVWCPEQLEGKYRGVMKKNRERVCLGYYVTLENDICGNNSLKNMQPYILELVDNSYSSMSESSELKRFIDIILPYPKRYKPLFRGSLPIPNLNMDSEVFTIWQPIPPSSSFISMGIVITKGDVTPLLQSIRCIPNSWCILSNIPTKFIGHLEFKYIQTNLTNKKDLYLNKNREIIGLSMTNKYLDKLEYTPPVTFCCISSIQILGVIIDIKSSKLSGAKVPNLSSSANISGNFILESHLSSLDGLLYEPINKNTNSVKSIGNNTENIYWIDIASHEFTLYFPKYLNSKRDVHEETIAIPRIQGKRADGYIKNSFSNSNSLGIFGL